MIESFRYSDFMKAHFQLCRGYAPSKPAEKLKSPNDKGSSRKFQQVMIIFSAAYFENGRHG